MANDMERDFCARCAIKHLGKAKVLMDEAHLGYPHHVWFAMANMSEAEDEIVMLMPEEATMIRTERIKMQDELQKWDGDRQPMYVPDYTRMMYTVAQGALLEEVQHLTEINLGPSRPATEETGNHE